MEENQNENKNPAFESLDILISRWKDGTFGEIIDDWKWIFSYSARYKGAIAFYIILGIFSTSMGLVSSVASKYMIDIITGYETSRLWVMIAIMVGSTVFSLTFSSIISRITAKLSIDINNDIQADIFDKIVDSDWLALNKYSNGDILNRFNGDIGTVSGNAISWLPTIIIAIYNFIATFFVILHYDWIMAVIALASAPFLLLMSRFMIKKQRDYSKKVREMSSDLMTFEVEAIYNFDTIKSFGVAPHYSKKMRWWQSKFRDISLKYNLFSIKTNILMSVMGTLVQFAAFGYCLFRLWTGDITYGTMTLFLQQRSNLSSAFSNVVSIIPSFLNSSVSAHRIRELVELPREVHIPESGEMDKYAEEGFQVRMQDVNFSYVQGTRVITDSAFEANPGEIVALIGANGAGKTTLLHAISGIQKKSSGDILFEGSSLNKAGARKIVSQGITQVPEGRRIFSGMSVYENLMMGAFLRKDKEGIKADLKNIYSRFPILEKRSGQDASTLSGGEQQMLAMGRALMARPKILLLDEPSMGLAPILVKEIFRIIREINEQGTTILLVEQNARMALSIADRAYVMETGNIVLSGTGEELAQSPDIQKAYLGG